jgi:hypothetical protein
LLAVAMLAVGGLSLVSLAAPEPARAIPLNPLDPLQDILGAGVDVVVDGVGGMAVESLQAIFNALFAWPAKLINRELLGWLVAVPDYAIHPQTSRSAGDGSNLAQLGTTTSAMAFAALGAVATVSGIRYWAAGLTGAGGLEALEGLGRTVGAALFIVLWPWLFRHAADLANEAGAGLLGSGSVLDDTARMLGVAFAAGVVFNILAVLIAVGAAVLLLALLLTKIAVSATTALVFVGMPLAVMLWPVPELAWIARTMMRAFAVVLAIPLLWAVCFATFAAVGVDALALKGAGKVVDALVLPLVALALLWVTVVAPRTLARMAMLGAHGGGFVGRAASYVVARRADAAVAQKLVPAIAAVGGPAAGAAAATVAASARGPGAAGSSRDRSRGGAQGGADGGAPASRASTATGRSDVPSITPEGVAPPPTGGGLRTPSWSEIRDRVPVELAAAAARERATTPADVARAMRSLPQDARDGVSSLMASRGGQIRGLMAEQAARADVSARERDAYRVLAAASDTARAQGISAFTSTVIEPRPDSSRIAAPLADGGPFAPAQAQPPPASEPGAGEGASTPPLRGPDDPPGG